METEIVTKEPLKVKASTELGMGLRGCPWSGWARALGRLTASCIEMEGTAFMWVSGGLRAQGSMSDQQHGPRKNKMEINHPHGSSHKN